MLSAVTRAVHTIRLRRRWIARPQNEGVSYLRTFNCPTGLEPSQQVHLELQIEKEAREFTACRAVRLNGKSIAIVELEAGHYRSENLITKLDGYNEVAVELQLPAPTNPSHSTRDPNTQNVLPSSELSPATSRPTGPSQNSSLPDFDEIFLAALVIGE